MAIHFVFLRMSSKMSGTSLYESTNLRSQSSVHSFECEIPHKIKAPGPCSGLDHTNKCVHMLLWIFQCNELNIYSEFQVNTAWYLNKAMAWVQDLVKVPILGSTSLACAQSVMNRHTKTLCTMKDQGIAAYYCIEHFRNPENVMSACQKGDI